jgi:hypothetical protein
LRKRLRHRLGHDPIDSQRYLGYRLIIPEADKAPATPAKSSFAQAEPDLLCVGD